MSLKIQSSKHRIKRSNVGGQIPTYGPSTDHTDGTWTSLDIYTGEFFYNQVDKKLWIGGVGEVIPIQGVYNPTGSTISAAAFYGGTFYGDGSGLTGLVAVAGSPYRSEIFATGSGYTFSGTSSSANNTLVVKKVTGSATTVTLHQSPTKDDFFVVKDKKGDADVNNITINGGALLIDGTASYVISTQYESITCLFDGDNYIII